MRCEIAPQGHPFSTFFNAIQQYKESAPDDPRDTGELLVFCWGLVHGIAVLASNRELPAEYDALELADKIIWNTLFL